MEDLGLKIMSANWMSGLQSILKYRVWSSSAHYANVLNHATENLCQELYGSIRHLRYPRSVRFHLPYTRLRLAIKKLLGGELPVSTDSSRTALYAIVCKWLSGVYDEQLVGWSYFLCTEQQQRSPDHCSRTTEVRLAFASWRGVGDVAQ